MHRWRDSVSTNQGIRTKSFYMHTYKPSFPSLRSKLQAVVKMSNLALTGLRRRSENDDQTSSRVVQIWRTGAPRPLLYPQPDEDRDLYDPCPWRIFEERVRTGPYGFSRFPLQPYSPMRILIVSRGGEDTVNPRLRQFISNSPPRVRNDWQQLSMPPVPEDPGLTDDEFSKAMKKLKKQVYTPPYPRRRTRKRGLFGKWTSSTAAEDRDGDDDADMNQEEGKECTICLETFVLNEKVLVTPCNHMFHDECLVPWVKSHGQCPVCRLVLVERRELANPRSGGSHGGTNDTNHRDYNNEESDDVLALDLISLTRAMEEAFNWVNSSHTSPYP